MSSYRDRCKVYMASSDIDNTIIRDNVQRNNNNRHSIDSLKHNQIPLIFPLNPCTAKCQSVNRILEPRSQCPSSWHCTNIHISGISPPFTLKGYPVSSTAIPLNPSPILILSAAHNRGPGPHWEPTQITTKQITKTLTNIHQDGLYREQTVFWSFWVRLESAAFLNISRLDPCTLTFSARIRVK